MASELPAGVEVIAGDMESSWQVKLIELCIDSLRSSPSLKDVPKSIKAQADKLYGRLWHVVIVHGQHWSYFGHEPNFSLVFRYGKHVFIVWKTPIA